MDYLHTLENNAFCNLITLPTSVTPDSETIIDQTLTNVTETAITPGVLHYKISDHNPIYCLISIPTSKNCQKRNPYLYRNLKLFDGSKFCEDLEISLTPLVSELLNSPLTNQSLDLSFKELVKNKSEIIDKHAPQQIASRKQKRIQKNPWLTKGLSSTKNKQKSYKTFFLQGTDWEKTLYKAYANKLTRVKNLSK